MRQFIAIPLPDVVRQNIDNILNPFRELQGLKPVKTENLHLTLVFIGDKGSGALLEKIREISFKPFDLSTSSLELFPERRPRLLWIELKEADGLSELHRKLAVIYDMDEELKPHITIARIKWLSRENKKLLMELTGQLNPYNIHFRVTHFNLYSSELKPGGPVYRVVESFSAAPGS
jgi:RNA 2',3'-cyclic 3'-phosphodiesterase